MPAPTAAGVLVMRGPSHPPAPGDTLLLLPAVWQHPPGVGAVLDAVAARVAPVVALLRVVEEQVARQCPAEGEGGLALAAVGLPVQPGLHHAGTRAPGVGDVLEADVHRLEAVACACKQRGCEQQQNALAARRW